MKPTADETRNKQCFNCGKDLETHANFCPHCGAAFPVKGSRLEILLRGIAVAVLMMVALICGAVGICALIIGAPTKDLTGLYWVIFTCFCVWKAATINK